MTVTITAPIASQKSKSDKQNITLSLSKETLRKARVLAAKRETSVSGLLTQQIDELVEKNDSYEQAKASALAMLRSGFGFGKIERMSRDEIYDRKAARVAAAEYYASQGQPDE